VFSKALKSQLHVIQNSLLSV